MKGELISQAEYARRRGVSRQYVGRLIKSGKLSLVDGKIDFDLAEQQLDNVVDSTRSNSGLPGRAELEGHGSTPLMEAKRLHEEYKARLAKLRYEEARGILIEKSEVEREAYAVGRTVRDAMLAIPSRLRDMLAAEDDPKKVHRLIEREIELALEDLSKVGIEK